MQLIDRLPWLWLSIIAAWLAVAPITPEPHLMEKIRMLTSGTLTQALDIFDLAFHAVPLLLLALKSARCLHLRQKHTEK
jgi:hypothetical protein